MTDACEECDEFSCMCDEKKDDADDVCEECDELLTFCVCKDETEEQDELPDSECALCGGEATSEDFCDGCGEFICESCNQTEGDIAPFHSATDHTEPNEPDNSLAHAQEEP